MVVGEAGRHGVYGDPHSLFAYVLLCSGMGLRCLKEPRIACSGQVRKQ